MGVCIRLVTETTRFDEAEMTLNGLAGCKALFRSLKDLPKVEPDWPGLEVGDCIYRPSDFRAWRKSVSNLDYNTDHFTAMLDALEGNEALWMDFGY